MKQKIKLQLKDRDLYEKLNMLNIVNEVIVNDNKTINTIIRKIHGLEGESLSNGKILVRKKYPMQLDVYNGKF